MINPTIPKPSPPSPWVNERECAVCHQSYRAFVPGVTWHDGRSLLYSFDNVYPSRRLVLWCMRVLKLAHWYAYHGDCGLE